MKPASQTHESRATLPRNTLYRWCRYSFFYLLLWGLLSQWDVRSLVIGIIIIPMATWCAMHLFEVRRAPSDSRASPAHGSSAYLSALVHFIPFFVYQSLRSGWDSALFAILPGRRLASGFFRYTSRLPAGRPRLFFVNLVSLLPGTVSITFQQNQLTIHTLDTRIDHEQALRECEDRVASLFRIHIDNSGTQCRVCNINIEQL